MDLAEARFGVGGVHEVDAVCCGVQPLLEDRFCGGITCGDVFGDAGRLVAGAAGAIGRV